MTKNPFLNAGVALVYIIILVNLITWGGKPIEHTNSLLVPIVMLSLLTLSAAAMAYFFFYQPFLLFFDGKKKEAISLAFKSFAAFAGFILIVIVILLSGIFR